MFPTAFRIGDFEVRWYGILITLGILLAIAFSWKRAKFYGLRRDDLLDLGVMIILVGIIGARLTYVLTNNIGYWFAHPLEIFQLQMQGLSFIGIIIFNIPAIAIFAKIRKLDFWRILDLSAPAIPIGYFFGRLGCFMNGCCYGPVNSTCGIVMQGTNTLNPYFPTQLLNALHAVVMFVVIYWIANKFKIKKGLLFTLFLGLYSLGSFGSEFLRVDPGHESLWGTPFNSAQWGNLGILALSVALFFILRKGSEFSKISPEEIAAIEAADAPKPKVDRKNTPQNLSEEEPKEEEKKE